MLMVRVLCVDSTVNGVSTCLAMLLLCRKQTSQGRYSGVGQPTFGPDTHKLHRHYEPVAHLLS